MKINKNRGFTLIELLVSMGLVITAATIVVGVITTTFRGSSKITSIDQLRQAGDGAITQLANLIEFADSFQGAEIINDDNSVTELPVCATPDQDNGVDSIKISVSGQTRTISCTNADVLTLDGKSVIDEGSYQIDSNSCQLSCSQVNRFSPPVIGIQFNLSPIVGGSSVNNINLNTFSKTIKMQNPNQ